MNSAIDGIISENSFSEKLDEYYEWFILQEKTNYEVENWEYIKNFIENFMKISFELLTPISLFLNIKISLEKNISKIDNYEILYDKIVKIQTLIMENSSKIHEINIERKKFISLDFSCIQKISKINIDNEFLMMKNKILKSSYDCEKSLLQKYIIEIKLMFIVIKELLLKTYIIWNNFNKPNIEHQNMY